MEASSSPPPWDPDRDEWLVCVAVRPETHDISTFVFAPLEPRLFRFLPGQFMTFELDGAGVQRCYTIASPPTRPWRIEVSAKRAADGPGSVWLHASMRPGVRVRAQGPMGDFTFGLNPAGKYLFLSAGSGITPLMSMARTLHDLGSDADVLFLHSARSPADLPFAGELSAMARRPAFRSVSIVESDAPGARWDGFRGRLSPAMLAMLAPDLLEREAFCCGPAPYMAAVRGMLGAAEFDLAARYHEESFEFGAVAPDERPERLPLVGAAARAAAAPSATVAAVPVATLPALPVAVPSVLAELAPAPAATAALAESSDGELLDATADITARTFTVQFPKSGRSIACPSGTTVLAAARAAGVRLPSACAKGVCGTCKSRLVSGTVDLKHGGGIRQREIDAGLTLLCCARPTSDLVVDR